MDILYRRMTINDYDSAIALWNSLPGMGLSGADERSEIEKFIKMNTGTCWVAVIGSYLAGTILGGSDGRRGYIYHLAVRTDLQQQGIGKILLAHCLDAFLNAGIQKCHLMVYPDNLAGITFWEKMGWTIRKDVLTMSKELGEDK